MLIPCGLQCLCATVAELSGSDREYTALKTLTIFCQGFEKKFGVWWLS